MRTLLLQFLVCKKGDVVDLKMMATYLSVWEDLLSNYVFENGFHVTKSQSLAVLEQQEAGNAEAATVTCPA